MLHGVPGNSEGLTAWTLINEEVGTGIGEQCQFLGRGAVKETKGGKREKKNEKLMKAPSS